MVGYKNIDVLLITVAARLLELLLPWLLAFWLPKAAKITTRGKSGTSPGAIETPSNWKLDSVLFDSGIESDEFIECVLVEVEDILTLLNAEGRPPNTGGGNEVMSSSNVGEGSSLLLSSHVVRFVSDRGSVSPLDLSPETVTAAFLVC